MNLWGALAGTAVAATVGLGLVDAHCVTGATLICGLLGAVLWNLITWRLGLPSSSSHALIGGLVGAAVASAGNNWNVVIWSAPVAGKPWYAWGGLIYKVIIPMLSSPVLGFAVGFLWMAILYILLARCRPSSINNAFRKLQILSAGYLGFSHGSNDAQHGCGRGTELQRPALASSGEHYLDVGYDTAGDGSSGLWADAAFSGAGWGDIGTPQAEA